MLRTVDVVSLEYINALQKSHVFCEYDIVLYFYVTRKYSD
jgi:hypothetical protein